MSNGISYEEYLERNGSLTYTNSGVSMLPLLRQGRDLFTVRKISPLYIHMSPYSFHPYIPEEVLLFYTENALQFSPT